MRQAIIAALGLLALAGCGPDTLIIHNETDANIVGVSFLMMNPPSAIDNNSNCLASAIAPGETHGLPWMLSGEVLVRIYLDPNGLLGEEDLPLLLHDLTWPDFVCLYSTDYGAMIFEGDNVIDVSVIGSGGDWGDYSMEISSSKSHMDGA